MLNKKELEDIKRQIDQEEKAAKRHVARSQQLKQLLIDSCDHADVTEYREYDEGTYLNRASTVILTRCNMCNKLIKETRETHDFYG
jgi:hypothetical protein